MVVSLRFFCSVWRSNPSTKCQVDCKGDCFVVPPANDDRNAPSRSSLRVIDFWFPKFFEHDTVKLLISVLGFWGNLLILKLILMQK